jgi:hypothetical protein
MVGKSLDKMWGLGGGFGRNLADFASQRLVLGTLDEGPGGEIFRNWAKSGPEMADRVFEHFFHGFFRTGAKFQKCRKRAKFDPNVSTSSFSGFAFNENWEKRQNASFGGCCFFLHGKIRDVEFGKIGVFQDGHFPYSARDGSVGIS